MHESIGSNSLVGRLHYTSSIGWFIAESIQEQCHHAALSGVTLSANATMISIAWTGKG